ncbi:hypothetical protein H072_1940 [Dactylellina haptotyla CBS 200.50]|uniref:Histidine-specific methyltransferase SAM-dependent domain-containing protein n=1 Tax=Dactylellina haptotyla (strain CBS 200.50) TaxID=1284197 RepID=S8AMI1_DACHA|nr:hypothetical protein H072_1940 [Dactylellina haptotyla CBS 200.50]
MVKPATLARDPQDEAAVDVGPGPIFKNGGTNGFFVNSAQTSVEIIDIRTSHVESQLNDDIVEGLSKGVGEKTLPTMLLYDQAGLRIFEEITYTDDYYLTNAEIEVLSTYAAEIAARVPDGAAIVELGSGNLRKVNILLQAIEASQKRVDYFALDLSRPELERTFSKLPNGGFKYVRCFGLHGTYDDGMLWLQSNAIIRDRPRFILWLGSSIGNFEREGAEGFLQTWREQVLRPGSSDRILVAFDSCEDAERVYWAYNDRQKVTERFILNGLVNANKILGKPVFDVSNFEYYGEYDIANGRHQASYLATKDMTIDLSDPVQILKGEKIRVERSHKFSETQTTKMFETSGLNISNSWGQLGGEYTLHLLYNPVSAISLDSSVYAASPVPSTADWEELWKVWDMVTLRMVRKDSYLQKPIELRHPIIFYLGHIPTFLDVQLTKSTGSPATEPADYPSIFQRGIDPDVNDPSQCHSHSEVPDTWPPLEEIKLFQTKVRDRVRKLTDETDHLSISVRRALWIGFEHEVMHLETLLYMLLQHDLTIPPAGVPVPDFRSQFLLDSTSANIGGQWTNIPGGDLILGTDDMENHGGHFTWDNEKPAIKTHLSSFQSFSRPITNGEYAVYLEAIGSDELPKSWTMEGKNTNTDVIAGIDESDAVPSAFKGLFVKTVFGPVPMIYAQYWPVLASYTELDGCAKWMGGRLPTREELQGIYAYFEVAKKDLEAKKLAAMIDAVNGHLSMDGVHITPPAISKNGVKENMTTDSDGMFADLVGANVSFRRWHPTCVHGKLCGRGDGGAWEWTSTVLKKWDGFKAMELYPEYTSDFFDDKHNIVLGASWATHSRIAGRRTFVNWYQRAYQFAWCTGRLVRDLPFAESK